MNEIYTMSDKLFEIVQSCILIKSSKQKFKLVTSIQHLVKNDNILRYSYLTLILKH